MTNKKILSAFVALALGAATFAQAPWANPKVVQELGLTAQQQQQLQDMRYKHQREMIDLRRDMEIKELALKEEMSKDQPNEAAVDKAIDAAAQSRSTMEKARFRHMQEARAILTPEQWQKARAWMQAHRGQFGRKGQCGLGFGRGQRSGMGMGPRGFGQPPQQGGDPGPDDPPPPPPPAQ